VRAVSLLAVTIAVCWSPGAEAAPPAAPAGTLAELDAAFAASARDLARRATAAGAAQLATLIDQWDPPRPPGRQMAFAIPPRLEKPATIAGAAEESIWSDFVAARRARAAGLFEHAVFAAGAHDRQPTRDELADPPEGPRPPLPQRSCAALELVQRTLRDDPEHERARLAGGWVKRGDAWVSAAAVRHLDRGEVFDPEFGWLPAARLERYRAGERYDAGRWVPAAEDEAKHRDLKHAREFHGDHWEIVTAVPLERAGRLSAQLEQTRAVWRQVFGAFTWEPADLERLLAGRVRAVARTPHAAILCRDRDHYVSELARLEPRAEGSEGLYWLPTKTIWFHAGQDGSGAAGPDPVTVHHEGTHQLFAEARPELDRVRHLAGERCGFWAIEAAGCYMESIEPASFGWTVGGRETGRVPDARARLAGGFFVPLDELSGMGREAFQNFDRLPDLYAQVAGLADFLMNGADGALREPFVEYLVRVYSGTADPDTLARLCKQSYAELDDAYRRHLAGE